MSSLCGLCCFPSVKKQKHDFIFFFRSMYNKTIIRFGFRDISVRVISLTLRLQLITLTSTLIILDITKTSSNTFFINIQSFFSAIPSKSSDEVAGTACDNNGTVQSNSDSPETVNNPENMDIVDNQLNNVDFDQNSVADKTWYSDKRSGDEDDDSPGNPL